MRCPLLFTSRLNLRRADSMGSPSPTWTLMSTFRDVVDAGDATVCVFYFSMYDVKRLEISQRGDNEMRRIH